MSRFFQCAKGLSEIYVYLSIIYIINTFSESSKRNFLKYFVHFFMGTIENICIRYLSELLGVGKSDGECTYHDVMLGFGQDNPLYFFPNPNMNILKCTELLSPSPGTVCWSNGIIQSLCSKLLMAIES